MKRFTELLENYREEGLKFLSRINEEPTEDEFNKEVKVAIKKSEGKIRNKRIAKPEVLAVEIEKGLKEDTEQGTPDSQPPTSDAEVKKLKDMKKEKPTNIPCSCKEDVEPDNDEDDEKKDKEKMDEDVEDLFEKTLTPAQKAKAEEVVKSMKGDEAGFQKRYGDRWKSILYGTATAIAKKSA